MKKVNWHFQRKALAESYLQTLYQGAVSRIALLDVRRTGKTTFLLKDLFPIALENGFVPIYINLWSEPDNPTLAITQNLNHALLVLDDKVTSKLREVANTEIKKLEVGNNVFVRRLLNSAISAATNPASQSYTKLVS
jgi:hypothetical protein